MSSYCAAASQSPDSSRQSARERLYAQLQASLVWVCQFLPGAGAP